MSERPPWLIHLHKDIGFTGKPPLGLTRLLHFLGCENKHQKTEIILFIIPFINSVKYEIIHIHLWDY
jgi:hypothetical protein